MKSTGAKAGWRRRLSALIAGALTSLAIVALPAAPVNALSGSEFIPGLIIGDAQFYDGNAMTEAQIQLFLASKGSGLAGYTFTVASRGPVYSERTGNLVCQAFQGGTLIPASTIIFRAQQACGISAKVILVTLQKEQGLITKSAPSQAAMDRAMGYACPDTAPCAPTTLGFGNQVYSGALQLNTYKQGRFARQPGMHAIQFNPNAGCGSTIVNIQNYATAALYNYTPYQPNAAALANLGGTGDSCSSYGNRNFWYYYNAWFGSTFGNGPYPAVGPGIIGTTTIGSTLTAVPGNWAGSPTFAYVWLSCATRPDAVVDTVPSGCMIPSGSTGNTYVISPDDAGRYIGIMVTATNSAGSLTTGMVMSARAGTPANLTPPTLTGVATVGATWTLDIGTWSGTPTPTMAIYWLRCSQPLPVVYTTVPSACSIISGQNGTAYTSTADDVGKYLSAQVGANNSLGFALAGAINTVPVGFPVNVTVPTVSGSAAAGSTWTVDPGTWTGSPAPTLAIYWLRCDQPQPSVFTLVPAGCVVISGARGTSYTSTAADIGKYLTAQIGGNGPLGFTLAGAVNTVAIDSGRPANTVPPVVSGDTAIGSTWSVNVGTWTGLPAPTIVVYWLRCQGPVSVNFTTVPSGCAVIPGANLTTYVTTAADAGKYVTAQVGGNSSIGFALAGAINTVAMSGTPSGPPTTPANTAAPTVTGTASIGSTWTVNVGTWTGTPAPTMAIYWLRCDRPMNAVFTTIPAGCIAIPQANGTSYVITAHDAGKFITAQVGGNSPLGFALAGAVSTNPIASAFPANTVAPTVAGTPAVGSVWTVNPGTWTGTPAPTIVIYWIRCAQPVSAVFTTVPAGCTVIEGQHGNTYVSTAADSGKYVTAQLGGNSPLGFALAGAINQTATT